MRRTGLWQMLWLICGLPAGLPAQDAAPPLYTVEIIVFRHLDQSRNTPELRLPPARDSLAAADDPLAAGWPREDQVPATPPVPAAAPRDDAGQGPQPGFILLQPRNLPPPMALPPDQLGLNDILQRLQRLDAYQPLAHIGWEQGADSRDIAETYWLSPEVEARSGVTGSIKLYRERFLHLELNLQLADPGPASSYDSAPAGFSIQESRLLRDDRVQYFDHPGFGVIARVSRRETPAPRAAAAP